MIVIALDLIAILQVSYASGRHPPDDSRVADFTHTYRIVQLLVRNRNVDIATLPTKNLSTVSAVVFAEEHLELLCTRSTVSDSVVRHPHCDAGFLRLHRLPACV